MRRILATAAALLTAIVGLSLTTASAATLNLATTPGTFFMQPAACAPGTANGAPVIGSATAAPGSSGSFSGVSLSNIPTACQGLPLEVFVHGPQGTLMASTATPSSANSSAVTVNVPSYTGTGVADVVLRIGGWLFPTNWTPPTPMPTQAVSCVALDGYQGNPTGQACTVTFTTNNVAYNPWPTVSAYDVSFIVSTPAPSWAVVVDTSHAALPQIGVTSIHTNGNPATGQCVGTVFTGYKNTSWGSNNGYLVMRNDGGSYNTRLCP